MACYFFAIAHLPLADAVLLNQSIPLFVPLVERVWLGEPIPAPLWRVLLIGFAGLLLILRPGFGVFQPVALVGLASAVPEDGIRPEDLLAAADRALYQAKRQGRDRIAVAPSQRTLAHAA